MYLSNFQIIYTPLFVLNFLLSFVFSVKSIGSRVSGQDRSERGSQIFWIAGVFLPCRDSRKKWRHFCPIGLFLVLVSLFPGSLWAQDTTPPTVSSATVDETILVVNFNEGLASVSGLTNSAFTVKKMPSGGSEVDQTLIGTPTVRGRMVTLTLSSPVIASDRGTVTVSYTVPSDANATLRDAADNAVVDFTDQRVLNLEGGICPRSEGVRNLILDQITRVDLCDEITNTDLRNIVELNFSEQSGTPELKSGDLSGLTNLIRFVLRDKRVTNLQQDLFEGLTSLESLDLRNNSLTSLHEDLFDGLTNLRRLSLENNSLTELHENLFEGLSGLKKLYLDDNSLTNLHEDLFDGLSSLEILYLSRNSLTNLHEDLFDGLTSLEELDLRYVYPTSLHEDLFDGLTNLKILYLSYNSLTSLHEDLFEGLTGLTRLDLNNNSPTGLHEDLFEGLTNLEELRLNGNSLSDLHEDLFEGLTRLNLLNLAYNALAGLHEDLFEGLSNLRTVGLSYNSLMSLHEDLFEDIRSAIIVFVSYNSLTCIPSKILEQGNVTIRPSSLVACPDPTITLSLNHSTIGEEDEATEVTVTATLNVVQATTTPVTVSVGSGTATSGTDFTAVSDFMISIPANTLSATGTFTLTPTSDTVDEPDETVMITGTSTVEDVTVNEPRLTIMDDDAAPTVTLHLSPTSIGENAGSSTVTATLNHPSSEETTVTISVDPTSPATASDYALSGSTLTIAAGATESTETVTITAEDNDVIAPGKIVTVQGTASNTQGIIDPTDVELTITDDDLELTVTLNLSSSSISENEASTTVTATLNHVSTEETTITISVEAISPATASDYTLSRSTLTIAAGETESTETVTITAVDNPVDAPDKTIQVQGTATNAQGVTGPAAVELTITDDEEAPTMTLNLASVSIAEDGESTTVTAMLSHPSSEETMITVSVLPDVPATTADYTLSNSALTIAAGATESTETVIISTVNNHVDAPDKTVQVHGEATNPQGVTNPTEVELTIRDDEDTPTVLLSLSPISISENEESSTVTAMLSHASSNQTTITISALPDPPTTASDYTLSGNTLTIAAGETESTGLVTITAENNSVNAPEKKVQVQGEAINSHGISQPESVQLTIIDDDEVPIVNLRLSSTSIGENEESTTLSATLSHASGVPTTITIIASPTLPALDSDYTLSSSTLTIAAGETSSTGTVTITAVNNSVDAPDKRVTVQGVATNPTGVTQPTDLELTIIDDEATPKLTLVLSPESIREDAQVSAVTATLSHPSSAVTTVMVSAAAVPPWQDSEYALSENPILTIPAGATFSTGTVTITAVDDHVDTPNKAVQVQGEATNVQGVTDPTALELTILDNEEAPAVMLSLSSTSIGEDAGSTIVGATLSHASCEETTVTISVEEATQETDFTLSSNLITIEAWETKSSGTVTITAVDNEVSAPDRIMRQVRGVAENVQGITQPASVELMIIEDEEAPTVTLILSSNSISENEESTTVTAMLSHPSSGVTTVRVTVLPDAPATESDYSLSDNTLTILAGATTTSELVTITTEDNNVDALDKTVTVRGVAENAQGITNPEDLELTITDDEDTPMVMLRLSSNTISEYAGSTTVTGMLSHPSSAVTTIVVSVRPSEQATATDYELGASQTLTIAAGETESTGLVTITAVDNEIDAPDKTVQVQGSATNVQGITGPSEVELTITDEDAAPTVTLVLSSTSIREGGESTTVTAILSRPSGKVTTVEVTTLPDAPATNVDYSQNGTTLTIPPGATGSTGLVTITSVDNQVDTPDKTVQVQGTATNVLGIIGPTELELMIMDDDEAPRVTLLLSSSLIGEDGETTTVTATLNRPSSQVTTVEVTTLPNAPATDSDYILSINTTLTIAAGETRSTGLVTITSVTNDVDAPDKTLQVKGISANEQGIIDPVDVKLTITDGTAPPAVTLVLSPASISENAESTTVIATLNRASSEVTTVTVNILPIEPAFASDYVMDGNTLTIAAGQTSSTGAVTITAVNNLMDAPDKTIQLQGTAVNAQGITNPANVELTILDDDVAPAVTLLLSPNSINENAGTATVSARLNHPSSEATTVEVIVLPNTPALDSDYVLSGNTLTIAAGTTESTGRITITAVDNEVNAPDKIVQVQGTATNAQGVTNPTNIELTIIDDEDVPTVILALMSASITENAGITTVTATLNRPSSEITTIVISALPNASASVTDFALSGNLRLTIAAGATISTGVVTITAVDNEIDTPDKTLQVQGITTNRQGVTGPEAIELTITDDDLSPTVTIHLSPVSIAENAGFTTVTATLDRPSSEVTTIDVTAIPNAPATELDYTLSGSTLTIAAGETGSSEFVTITANDNAVHAPNKTIQVQGIATNLHGVTNPIDAELTILDDDLAPTVTLMLSQSTIGENAGQTAVTAMLSRPSSEAVTIEVTVLPNLPATELDYTQSGSTLTIAAGETSSSGFVTITAVDNATDAPDKTVQVEGFVTSSQGLAGSAAVPLTITDDEATPTLSLVLDPSTIVENGGKTEVTALLSHPSSAMTTVVVSALANPPAVASDVVLSQNTILTIATGETGSTGLVTITAVDNAVDGPNKTVQVQSVAKNTHGVTVPADVVLTITDDEVINPTVSLILTPASITENDGQATVTATLNPPSSAMTTIMVSVLPNAPATESDYMLSTNTMLTIVAGEAESTGLVTITGIDNELIALDKTVQVQGTATNIQGVSGPAAMQLTITDDEATPPVAITLTSTSISENAGQTSVTATLNQVLDMETTIAISVLPEAPATDSDYLLSDNVILTIAEGEIESTGLVTITAVDNGVDAPNKTVQVQGSVTSAQGITGPAPVKLTIIDDEEAPAVTLLLDPFTIAENGGMTNVTAVLDQASSEETTITVMVLPDALATESDYMLSTNTVLTIDAGTTTSRGTVTITAADNEVDAPDKSVQVQGVATNSLGVTDPIDVKLTITDDEEAPRVTLVLDPTTIDENGGMTTVTAIQDQTSSAMTTVVVSVLAKTPAMDSDYLLSDNRTLTIAAGQVSSSGEVTITALDNTLDGPDKTLQLQGTATNPQGVTLPVAVTLTITDDDESFPTALNAMVTMEEDTSYPFSISDFGYSDPEGDPMAAIQIERHPEVGTLTLNGTGFPAGTQISADQISSGELVFTPVANAYGPEYTNFDYKVSDETSESLLAAVMTIDVTPTNDDATGRPQIIGSMQLGQVLQASVEEIQDLDGMRLAQAHEPGYGYHYQWLRIEGSMSERIGEGSTYVPVETDAGASLVVQVSFVDDAGFEEVVESLPRQVRYTSRIRTAWMGRLGRTVADQVLRAVQCEGHLRRSQHSEVYLAGQPLTLASLPNYVHAQEVKPDQLSSLLGNTDPVYRLGHTLTRERLLHGSSFRHGMQNGSGISLRGHGSVSRIQGADGALNLEGRVSSGMLGADWIGQKGGLGVLVAHTRSEGDYSMADDEGALTGHLTGVYPNGCYALSSGVTAWGVVGYGHGSMTVEQISTPVDLWMAGGGIYGRIRTVTKQGLELGIRSDALMVQMSTSGTEELSEDQAQVSRLRLGLQGTMRGIRLGTRSTIEPMAELALRHDGGDAETGFGVDMQVGFLLSSPASGLSMEVRTRAVLTHQDLGLQDQGLAGAVTWDTRPHSSEGFQIRVEHTIGAGVLGSAEQLLRAETIQPQYAAHQAGDLRVQAGYGFALFSEALTLKPEVSLSGRGQQRRYEMGWNLARADEHLTDVQLFVGTTGQTQQDAPLQIQHLIRLQLKRQF